MSTLAPQARLLRLVPKPTGGIDADMVAFTVMDHLDTYHPEMWAGSTIQTRVSVRNAIIRAVLAEDAKR